MNTITENLLTAMDKLSQANNKNLQFDRTVLAKIVEVRSIEKGEYIVEYQSGKFQAWATPGTAYEKGEEVLVKIPEGDMSNKKIIEGTSKAYIDQLESIKRRLNIYSYNLAKELGIENKLGLIAAKEDIKSVSLSDDRDIKLTLESTNFKNYMKNHSCLMIGVDITTQFLYTIGQGDYGLKISLYPAGLKENPIVKYLNTDNFSGSIYDFSISSHQEMLFDFIPGDYDKLTIELFEKLHYKNPSSITNINEVSVKNIFFENFEIYLTSSLNDLPTYVINPEIKFTEDKEDKKSVEITPVLYYGGKAIDDENITWSWQKLDASWTNLDLPSKVLTVEYNKDTNWLNSYYKAVAKLEGEEYESEEIVVFNEFFNWKFYVTEDSITNSLKLNKEKIKKEENSSEDPKFIIDWEFKGDSSIRQEDSDIWQIPEFVFHNYQSRDFVCYVYSKSDLITKNLITKIDYTFQAAINFNRPFSVPVEGTDWFYYDGYSALTTAQNQFELKIPGTITQMENGKEVTRTISNLKWYWRGNQKLKNDNLKNLNLSDSMLSSIDKITENDNYFKIVFTVNKRFTQNKSYNNYFLINCLVNGDAYTQKIPLNFIINGQSGTNGTSYYVGLEPTDGSGYYLERYDPNIKTFAKTFNLEVRSNSDNNEEVEFEVIKNSKKQWQYVSVGCAAAYNENNKQISITANTGATKAYIKFDVKIGTTIIPCFQSFTIGAAGAPAITTNLPYSIMYDANGYNPNWASYTKLTIDNNELFGNNDIFNDEFIKEKDKIIKFLPERDKNDSEKILGYKFTLKPRSILDPNNFEDVITITYDNKIYYHTIISHYNRYGNETINGWDGQKLDIDGKGQYVYAPTIGAGRKNNENKFSGVIMGQDSQQKYGAGVFPNKPDYVTEEEWATLVNKPKTGIYGYRNGKLSFGLMEDGNAYFEGTVKASSGHINNWKIGTFKDSIGGSYDNSIYSVNGDSYRVFLRASDTSGHACFGIKKYSSIRETDDYGIVQIDKETNDTGYTFYINNKGYLFAKDANIEGTITATSGSIGGSDGWHIGSGVIYSGDLDNNVDPYVYISSANGNQDSWFGANSGSKNGNDAYFYVSKEGVLSAKKANISGHITASSGSIGGWTIPASKNHLFYKKSGEYAIAFSLDAVDMGTTARIFKIGKFNPENSTWGDTTGFQVTGQGVLTCTGAIVNNATITGGSLKVGNNFEVNSSGVRITGTLHAGSDSTIGGWTLDTSKLYNGSVWLSPSGHSATINGSTANMVFRAGSKFGVATDGTLYASSVKISGTITAGFNSVFGDPNSSYGSWSIVSENNATEIRGRYGLYETVMKVPYSSDVGNSYNNSAFGIRKFKNTNDRTYDSTPFRVTIDGNVYAQNSYLDNIYIKQQGIQDAMVLTGGKIYNKSYLTTWLEDHNKEERYYVHALQFPRFKTGTPGTSTDHFQSYWVFVAGRHYKKGIEGNKESIEPHGTYGQDYVRGFKVNYAGTLHLASAAIIDSDRKFKTNIKFLSESYEKLYNSLIPRYYQIKGDTAKYHTGFVAQEVEEAVYKADLTLQDFSGLVLDTQSKTWGLAYEEFIALNTWQIQKAKARISELEARVSQLESLLQANLD